MARSGMATRQRILATVSGLFYRRGLARGSVDEITAAAGLARRTLY